MRHKKRSVLARFSADKHGTVLMMFSLTSLVVVGAVAGAIDYGRATHAERMMQAATDAAVMAAATASGTRAERTNIAQSFFDSNISDSFGTDPNLSVDIDSSAGTVSGTANSNVTTTFMSVFGINDIPISTTSMVAASDSGSGKNLEVAMMIDLTGSMGRTRNGMKKIDALKIASVDLIDIFFPNNAQTSSTTRLAIAPMADYVNAGPYASAVTGLPNRGPFNNRTNLKSTRHGPFSGRHSGSVTGAAFGSQHGATSASSAQGGATYDNGHCADPNAPASPISSLTFSGDDGTKPMGVAVTGSGTPPAQLQSASSGYYKTNYWDDSSNGRWEYDDDDKLPYSTSGYYVPMPASTSGVSYQMDSGLYVGVSITLGGSAPLPEQLMQANATGGYRKITGYSNGNFTYETVNSGAFLPLPESMTSSGGTLPQCTSDNNPNDGYLVSCVTERPNPSNRNDDTAPGSGDFLGPYNQTVSGAGNKLNYSEDGKCMTAGRELPAIIPLTNQRQTIEDFFNNATIGGSTPGHLGHAWAWYMLSPNWNSIWSGESQAADYTDTTVMKAAIIMTDGEYNTQYSNETSKAQALALCAGMRAAGIKVFTIGFGFTSSAADTAAADTLKQCVNNQAGSYFLAYDGDALRQVFKDIGLQLTSTQKKLVFTE